MNNKYVVANLHLYNKRILPPRTTLAIAHAKLSLRSEVSKQMQTRTTHKVLYQGCDRSGNGQGKTELFKAVKGKSGNFISSQEKFIFIL